MIRINSTEFCGRGETMAEEAKKAYAKKWREAHPNYWREWYAKHCGYKPRLPKQESERKSRPPKKTREERLKQMLDWQKTHKEHLVEYHKRYRKEILADPEASALAIKLWKARIAKGLKQSELAELAGCSRSIISAYETCKVRFDPDKFNGILW